MDADQMAIEAARMQADILWHMLDLLYIALGGTGDLPSKDRDKGDAHAD
jgi:hypothetical protein